MGWYDIKCEHMQWLMTDENCCNQENIVKEQSEHIC